MAGPDVPAFEMVRRLRDGIEHRIRATEDFKALTALNRQLALLERQGRAAVPLPSTRPENPFSYLGIDGLPVSPEYRAGAAA